MAQTDNNHLKISDLLILCMFNKIIKICVTQTSKTPEASEWEDDGTSDSYDVLIFYVIF